MVAIAADEPAPLLERLDPPRRASVLMALVGLVVLGVGLVALVMLGGWIVRRRARQRPRQRPRPTATRDGSPLAGPLPPLDAADDLRSPPGPPNGPTRDGP